jgi:hypothetical protein
MANTGEGGGSSRTPPHKPRHPPGGVPVHRGGAGGSGHYNPPPGSDGGAGSGSGSGSGSSGSGSSGYAAAQAHADAQAMAARRRAANRYLAQAQTMQQQINALKIALGSDGLRAALRIQLQNTLGTQLDVQHDIAKGYRARSAGLVGSLGDNENAISGQTYNNVINRGRERANAMSEATAQGAGESDMLMAQGASLRNWAANQSDANQSYTDTLRGTNTSLADLNADTRQALLQNVINANSDRNNLWSDYYSNRGEVLTSLGNTLGQQAEQYGLANEQIEDKSDVAKQKAASDLSGTYFRHAALMTGKTWKNPGIPAWIKDWTGVKPVESTIDSTYHASAANAPAEAKPEGATLRKWAA